MGRLSIEWFIFKVFKVIKERETTDNDKHTGISGIV